MSTVVVHDSPFEIPVGNVFENWESVELLVEEIRRVDGTEWSYTVTLAAGTRSLKVILDPIDGVNEPEAHRALMFYRTPRSVDSVLRMSFTHGVIAVEVIPIDELVLDVDDVPGEFLHE